MKYGRVYRNYFPSKGCFYDGTDSKNLYDANSANDWYKEVGKYMQEIQIVRPPKQIVKIKIPLRDVDEENVVEEDKEFVKWLTTAKIEPKMGYVIDQILDEYYYGIDNCFYKRPQVEKKEDPDFGVVFTMREIIDGIFRISPLKVRTHVEKETQKINFVDWDLGEDVYDVPFTYQGKEYKTNFFGLFGAKFREAIFPNSEFSGNRLMKWQREAFVSRGNITTIKAARGSGKSLFSTAYIATFLWKELNMPHEYDRPFLIVYGGLSREANLQVVDYLRAMAKKITTNKNILNWNKGEQILTLYDGYNERKIKFVSQGQEGQGFTGLRPHLVVLDEAARLEKRMYDVASGTIEAPIIIISTTKAEDKRNWFEDMYKEGVAKQRNYEKVEDLIKGIWIKFGMHKIKSREELQKKINGGVINEMRNALNRARPLVSLKYTIYDVEYLTEEQKQIQIDKFMASGEDICLAELFNELMDSKTIFNTDGLIESKIPDTFDRISCAFDEAEEYDNPAFVAVGLKGGIAYVIHSEILDKADYKAKYKRIEELLNKMKSKSPVVTFAADLTRVQRMGLREITDFVREPDFPILYTSSKTGDVTRKRPFYLVPKERMITIAQDEFFKKSNIIFDTTLDVTGGLIEELANFKRTNKGVAKGVGTKADDQVNAMMMALFGMYWGYIKDIEPLVGAGMSTPEERYDAILLDQQDYIDMNEYEKMTAKIVSNFW